MALDRNIRRYAVPVRGTIWGMNYNDRTERDIGFLQGSPLTLSDYNDFFPATYSGSAVLPQIGASKVCPIRILKSHFGELAECYVDIDINVASGDSDLTLKFAVGRFQSSSYDRVLTYSDAEINSSWRRMHGSDTPLSVSGGKISADLINLLGALPRYGDPNYIEDAFVLILAFNKTPTMTGVFKFNYLNIHTSVTGAI